MRSLYVLLLILILAGCSSTRTASYRYAQKQIERGDLNFEGRLRVDEYINAFPQDKLAKPTKGKDLAVKIDFFSDSLPKEANTTLAQVAVRTREANAKEKKQKMALSMVLDLSGSMDEDSKLADSKEAVAAMVSELPSGTEFALIVFSDESRVEVPPTVIDKTSRKSIKEQIRKLGTEGGTNIESGLVLGYATMTKFSKGAQSRLLLLTDGISNVGVTDPEEIAKKAKVQYLEGARISTVGLGYNVDEHLLRKVAEKGKGAYYFAENASALKNLFMKDLNSLMIPIVKNSSITIKSPSGTKINKVYGFEKGLEGSTFKTDIGELNSDDWRIFIVEIERTSSKVTSLSLSAEVKFTPANGKGSQVVKTMGTLRGAGKGKPQLNKVVARNSIVFANALALIEVSKLDKQQKYSEAMDIVKVQLANLEVARSLEDSKELAKEQQNLLKVQAVLEGKIKGDSQSLDFAEGQPTRKEPSQLRPIIKSALGLAEKVVPGPWSLVLSLIGLAL